MFLLAQCWNVNSALMAFDVNLRKPVDMDSFAALR